MPLWLTMLTPPLLDNELTSCVSSISRFIHNRFTALWILSGTTRVSRYQKKHSPLTPIVVINHLYLLPPSTTIHGILPIQSTCFRTTVFFHNVSKFTLVYLLAWHLPPHTPYISSPNHYLLFAAHAHTIATCFAVVLRLCQLILVSVSTLYLGLYLEASAVN